VWSEELAGVSVPAAGFALCCVLAIYVRVVQRRPAAARGAVSWLVLALNILCALLWLMTAAGSVVDLISVGPADRSSSRCASA
jgi:hypothetical protein